MKDFVHVFVTYLDAGELNAGPARRIFESSSDLMKRSGVFSEMIASTSLEIRFGSRSTGTVGISLDETGCAPLFLSQYLNSVSTSSEPRP